MVTSRVTPTGHGAWLAESSAEWVRAGLISEEQRSAILRRTTEESPLLGGTTPGLAGSRGRSQSLAVEALGYLGGVIVVVAAVLLGFQVWDDLSTAARLGIVGGAALLLVVAGAAVPQRAAATGARMRSVLWFAAVPAAAGFWAVLAADALDLGGTDVGVVTATGATAVAAALWLPERGVLQQAAMMVAAAFAASVTIVDLSTRDSLPGLGVWCVGVTWAVWAWGGVFDHRDVGVPLGAAVAIVGTMMTIPADPGMVLALTTAAATVGAAVLFRDLWLLGVGAVGSLAVLPAVVTNWWPDRLAAPLALLGVGLLLLGAALQVARRRRTPHVGERDFGVGTPPVAWAVAGPVLAVLAGVLLAVAVA